RGQVVQRNRDTVIGRHSVGEGDINSRISYGVKAVQGDAFWNIQRARLEAPINGARSANPNRKRRHQVIEEAVIVVWPKYDDELGVELAKRISGSLEASSNVFFSVRISRRKRSEHQGAV